MDNEALQIKVCGLKYPKNQALISKLEIDYVGFIFYKKSSRYALSVSEKIPPNVKKVGVFVDEHIDEIIQKIKDFNLDVIQLHGKESLLYVREFQLKLYEKNLSDVQIWKAIPVKTASDLASIQIFDTKVDAILLDAKGALPGGNGIKFDWDLLNQIQMETPLILSGGIKIDDVEQINNLKRSNTIWGVDINSGFEINPGLKDFARVKRFVEEIKNKIT
jgi:phosphoribosylanthranilate isomerase